MRADGKPVKGKESMYYLIPHFLPKRYDAMNMVTVDIPVAPMREYMNAKRREGRAVSHLALVLTAYAHMLKEYPEINNFVVNKRIYEHNDFTVSMVVLRPSGESAMSKIKIDLDDDVFTVQKKIVDFIETNRSTEEKNGLDKAMDVFVKMGFLMRIAINLARFFDKHGLLPKALIDVSPFHASLLISDLASIRANHIYHHVYEFGTTSVAITMGNLREVPKHTKDGIIFERCIPLGVVMDERICSGHYFAYAFELFQKYLKNPELLEKESTVKA